MTDEQYNGLIAQMQTMAAASHSDLNVLLHWIAGLAAVLLVTVFLQTVLIFRGASK